MRTLRTGSLLAFIGITALGSTSGDAKTLPSATELASQRSYAASLAKGRKLADAGKLTEAHEAFSTCLTLAPDDPTALSELGWVELRAKDFEHAEATTRKAIARADTPNLRAASLFNLGVILSKRSDRKGAIEAFLASLRLRNNATVLAELRKLDPQAAEALRLAPHAMEGPLAADDKAGKSLRAKVCWQSLAQAWSELDISGPDQRIKCTEQKLSADLAGSGMLDVQVWRSSGSFNWPKDTATLAIRTEKGWYLDTFDSYWSNRWVPGDLKIKGIELASSGDKKLVTVKWELSVEDWTWDLNRETLENPTTQAEGRNVATTFLIVAGIGPSGAPRVTPATPIGVRADFGNRSVSSELALSFPGSGVLKLAGPTQPTTRVPKAKFKDLLELLHPGEFSIEFP